MQFEHFALNVPDAKAMAAWYVENCGMRLLQSSDHPPYVHFLADGRGRVMMEIYTNPSSPTPDYAAQHPLQFHFALAVEDAATWKRRLVAAGALPVGEQTLDDGSRMVMLRDPWGVSLQLCERVTPMV